MKASPFANILIIPIEMFSL